MEHRGPVPFDEREVLLELESRQDDEGRAAPQAKQHHDDQAVDVKERQEADEGLLAVTKMSRAIQLQHVGDEIAMRQHHPLRQTGRAARIGEHGDLAGI